MKRLTTQDFIMRLRSSNPSVEVIDEYVNQRTKIKVRGISCGHVWMGNPHNLLAGHGCPECRYINNSKRSRKSNAQFLEELRVKNPDIDPLEEYQGAGKAIAARCNICGREFLSTPNHLLNGYGCKVCRLKRDPIQKPRNVSDD